MRRSRLPWKIAALFALGVYLIGLPIQEAIINRRPEQYRVNAPGSGINLAAISGPTPVLIAALGGFRTVAADLLWLKVDNLWDGGAWYLIPPVMESVVQLDPHFILGWQVYGWHLAYNLNAESVLQTDRRAWLEDGIAVLKRGVALNPKSFEMTFEYAWTLFDRAHDLYRAADAFYYASQQQDAKAYCARMYYRPFEHLLDFDRLWPAMKWAQKQFPDDIPHQKLVARDMDWWRQNWNNKAEHRKQIANENTARQQRAVPFWLYPNDPYWNVCPLCGLPTEKGKPVCENCFAWNFELKQPVRPAQAVR